MTDEPVRVRAPVVAIVDHGASTTVLGREAVRRFDGDSAALLRAVLEIHARPVGRAQLYAELAARAGTAPEALPAQPIDELIALLVGDGVLVAAPAPAPPPAALAGGPRRVVLGISGAIAAVDAPALVRGLQAAGCDVRVALTRSAARLVSRAALEAITHEAVWTGLWQRDARAPVPHVSLAEWAELVVVCPASATTISRIATGDCSELVAAIAAATRAPVVIVPSMNDAMYSSPAVQANLAALRDHGRHVVHPALGLEVAHRPHARPAVFGPAPPAGAVIDIVRHLLRDVAVARPRVPDGAPGWEQVWATTPAAQLPWHAEALEPPLAEALAARAAPGRRLIDLGTGDGLVAVAAAQLGYRVTAVDIAPSALGRARDRAEAAGCARGSIALRARRCHRAAAPRHGPGVRCRGRPRPPALPAARAARRLCRRGHRAGRARRRAADRRARARHRARHPRRSPPRSCARILPAFELVRATPTTLAGAAAQLFELTRLDAR